MIFFVWFFSFSFPFRYQFHFRNTATTTTSTCQTKTFFHQSIGRQFYALWWRQTVTISIDRLYCYAQKHVKSIRAVTRPGSSGDDVCEKPANRYRSIRRKPKKKFKVRHLHHSSPYHVSDHKAAITVGVIMGVFLICWVPFFCVNIVAAFCKTCIAGQTFKVLSWLGYSNSAFNPIIYSIFNTEFREAFKRILTTKNSWCCTQDLGNVHPRNSDRYVTDYAAKNIVMHPRSSADIEVQVSAIWPHNDYKG